MDTDVFEALSFAVMAIHLHALADQHGASGGAAFRELGRRYEEDAMTRLEEREEFWKMRGQGADVVGTSVWRQFRAEVEAIKARTDPPPAFQEQGA